MQKQQKHPKTVHHKTKNIQKIGRTYKKFGQFLKKPELQPIFYI